MSADTETPVDAAATEARESRVTGRDLIRALFREPITLLAVIFLICLVFGAVFAPWLTPFDPLLPNIFAGREPPLSEVAGPDGVGCATGSSEGKRERGVSFLSRRLLRAVTARLGGWIFTWIC